MDEKEELKQELLEILTDVVKTKRIEGFELIPNVDMNYGDGFVSHFYTGQVRNTKNGDIFQVAIKKCPAKRSEIMKSLFNNEIIFYESIFPMMRDFQSKQNAEVLDNIPNYICGSMEPNKEYIAMDNVKHHGFELYDKTKCFDEEHLVSIFKLYGKFHALSFSLDKSEPIAVKDTQKGIFNTFTNIPDQVLHQLKEPFEVAVANLESDDPQNIFKKASYALENMEEVYNKCSRYSGKYSCIIHGDCWSNNMLFKYNESGELDDVKLVDFQLTRKTTPIHDLSYFFYSGASKEDFDKLDEYLEIYHETFSQFSQELGFRADDLLPLNVLKDEWKTYSMLGVFMGIFLWELKLIPKDEAQKLGEIGQSLDETGIQGQWRVVLEKVFKDDRFKTRTKDILVHAVEYGIF